MQLQQIEYAIEQIRVLIRAWQCVAVAVTLRAVLYYSDFAISPPADVFTAGTATIAAFIASALPRSCSIFNSYDTLFEMAV